MNNQGSTLRMVTHDPRYAKFADRNIHLFDGRIVDENFEESESSVGAK